MYWVNIDGSQIAKFNQLDNTVEIEEIESDGNENKAGSKMTGY